MEDRTSSMWTLREMVERYLALSGGFGRPLALSEFPLNEEQVVRLFSSFDEDYHISRFFHFSKSNARNYLIGGENVSNVSIDQAIEEIL
jgi:hypothetical protein